MTVIKHDFGLKKRKAFRRFRALLKLDALHETNVKANPLPYLERASERIYQLEKALFEAAQALKPEFGASQSTEMLEVDKAEYERLLKCRAIVEESLARLVSAENEKDET